jgi:hypothetical protein
MELFNKLEQTGISALPLNIPIILLSTLVLFVVGLYQLISLLKSDIKK